MDFEQRFEHKMEFLLDQQAKFFAGMEELREQNRQINSRTDALTSRADALTSDLMELAEFVHEFAAETRAGSAELRGIVARQGEQIAELRGTVARQGEQTLASFAELRASVELLSGQQSHLTHLVTTLVEQHVDLRGTVASLAGTVAALAADRAADHKDLRDLRAVVADLAAGQKDLRDRVADMVEAQQHADERMNALIAVVDGVVRRLPPG